MRPSVKERARMFIGKARPSVSGSGGHDAIFAVACGLVVGFGLSDSDAWDLLCEYNATNCTPSWSDKDLARKLREARKQAERHPEKVGELAGQDRPDFTGPRSPANVAPPKQPAKPVQKPPSGGKPMPGAPARTLRTPFFNVRPFKEGAGARTARTVRTLHSYSLPIPNPQSSSLSKVIENKVSEKSDPKPEATKPEAPVIASPVIEKAVHGNSHRPAPSAQPRRPNTPPGERVDVTTVWNGTGAIIKNGKPFGNINEARRGRE